MRYLLDTNIVSDLFGGKHLGELHANYSSEDPQYDLAGTISSASLEQLGSSLWAAAWQRYYWQQLKCWSAESGHRSLRDPR